MKKKRLLKTTLLLIICYLIPVNVSAQTAAELDVMLATETVTAAKAARFVLGAAEMLPAELSGTAAETAAYDLAQSRGWIKREASDAITLQDTAFLIMNTFNIKGGIMYSIFRNPRYAYREMIYRRLIQGRADSAMKVSGQRLLQIIGSVLHYSGEDERLDALLQNAAGGIN